MTALDVLRATRDALPRTLGDRDSVAAMDAAMELAIDSGMIFRSEDAAALHELRIRTGVGIFDPFWEGYYARACIMGGTYPRLYETRHGFRAWTAPLVYRAVHLRGYRRACYAMPNAMVEDGRVAPGFVVLIERADTEADKALARKGVHQVWRCTSIGAAEIILCRYTMEAKKDPIQSHPGGAPARRWKLSRGEWQSLFPRKAATTEQAVAA